MIIKAKELIADGCCFSITKGDKIQVWQDPWAAGCPSFIPKLRGPLVQTNMKVKDLLTEEHGWNNNLVQEIFNVETVSREGSILAVIIKDDQQQFIKAIVNFSSASDICLAEAIACLEAIIEATSHGWSSFLVLGESK
ncbi:hypothetical protein Ancab_039266 [Ancistrocladus abbreviatus]